ncbi:DUF6230 family protein [Streptomyces sp. CA-181903]|uniref:DUF6230 family protein n=1 Tax=Streptomyces sp. CA-181903 TaxID=3240055 RepID=UPI003D904A10
MSGVADDAATPAEGRTVWRRAVPVAALALALVGVMAVAMAQGVLAASFAVSGTTSQISARKLTGKGLTVFTAVDRTVDGPGRPQARIGVGNATLTGLCESTRVNTPVGTVTFKLTAGDRDTAVTVDDLVIDVDDLTGDARFGRMELGRDASTLDAVPHSQGAAGQFGLQATDLEVDGIRTHARSATGGNFRLKGLALSIRPGDKGCY